MRRRSSLPFRAAPLRVEYPPSPGTLLTATLSSLSVDEDAGSTGRPLLVDGCHVLRAAGTNAA